MSEERKLCPLREMARGEPGGVRSEIECREADCAWWWQQADVAPENVIALFQSAREFGAYPIRVRG